MILQSVELVVLLFLCVVTGCLGWLVSQLVQQGRDAGAVHKDEQARLTETLAALALATKENQKDLTSRLDASEVVQSEAAKALSGVVTELREARREVNNSHTDLARELAGVALASHDAEERLQSAIGLLAASLREHSKRDTKTVLAVLDEVAADVRSLQPQPPVPVNIPTDEWVLDNHEHPAIRVTLAKGPRFVSKQKQLPVPTKALNLLTSVCQSLFGTTVPQSMPGMMSAAEGIIRTRVVFSYEKMAGLANGTYQHMQTGDGRWLALMCDTRGKIVEIGHLVTGINPASAISLGWQIATVVTAQHHLANIRQALSGLKQQLSGIELWLSSKEMGSLRSDFTYLDQVDHYLTVGAIPASELPLFLGKIEDIERSSLAAYDAAKIRIQASSNETIIQIGKKEKIKTEEDFHVKLKRFEDDCNIMTAALFVRARAGNTRRLLSLDVTISEHRITLTETVRQEILDLATSFCDNIGQVSPKAAWLSMPAKKQEFHVRNDDFTTRVYDSIQEQLHSLEDFQTQVNKARIGDGNFEFECEYDPQTQSLLSAQPISTVTSAKVR